MDPKKMKIMILETEISLEMGGFLRKLLKKGKQIFIHMRSPIGLIEAFPQMDIDLFIVDDHLEDGQRGLELVRRLREKGIKTPVIIMSDCPERRFLEEANKLEVSCCLGKPIQADKLYFVVQAVLKNELRKFSFIETSSDGTNRYLFPAKTKDGTTFYESASIVMPDRLDEHHIVCVSSQTGCEMGCKFCATGSEARTRVRNLNHLEMISQVLNAESSHNFRNNVLISIMGMGEPTLNLKNIRKLIGLSAIRHSFAISTIGLVRQMKRFVDMFKDEKKIKLFQLSLHFPDDASRSALIPAVRNQPIKKILSLGEKFAESTQIPVCLNFALFKGINDSDVLAVKLAQLIKGRPFIVRLSKANPYREFIPSLPERFKSFEKILEQEGVPFRYFYSRGTDKGSGCGQMTAKLSK